MSNQEELERAQAKTSEQQLINALEQGFHYAPRIAEAIVAEAQDCLSGEQEGIQVGQMCVLLAKQGAANGRAMRETELVRVVWTVDGGGEDREVAQKHGMRAVRQQRILRLLDEAVEQGAAASQEDLAHALHSSVRTIKRDCAELQGRGIICRRVGGWKGWGEGKRIRPRSSGCGWRGRPMIRLRCTRATVPNRSSATSKPLSRWCCWNGRN